MHSYKKFLEVNLNHERSEQNEGIEPVAWGGRRRESTGPDQAPVPYSYCSNSQRLKQMGDKITAFSKNKLRTLIIIWFIACKVFYGTEAREKFSKLRLKADIVGVLRSRNYLFSAPAPFIFLILAQAPTPF